MTKSITIGTIAIVLVLFLALAFKSADNDKKEYLMIFCDRQQKEISLSYSNGTFKTIEYLKPQGDGDQTPILKLINEQEALGYKLVSYDIKFPTPQNVRLQVITALLSK